MRVDNVGGTRIGADGNDNEDGVESYYVQNAWKKSIKALKYTAYDIFTVLTIIVRFWQVATMATYDESCLFLSGTLLFEYDECRKSHGSR